MAAGVKCDPVSWGVTGQMYVTSVSWGGLHRWMVWYVEGTAVVRCLGLIFLSQGLGVGAAGGGRVLTPVGAPSVMK